MKRIHTQKKSARRGKINQSTNVNGARFIWKSKFVIPIQGLLNPYYKKPVSAKSNGTYVRPKVKHPISFTQALRNQRGYSNQLNNKYSNI